MASKLSEAQDAFFAAFAAMPMQDRRDVLRSIDTAPRFDAFASTLGALHCAVAEEKDSAE
jgi:hypothetical protein